MDRAREPEIPTKGNEEVKYTAWIIRKASGHLESNKKIDPTNPIHVALFNTKRHAKIYVEEHPYLEGAKISKVIVKITEA